MVKLDKRTLRRAAEETPSLSLRDYILAALYLAGGRLSKLRLMKLLQIVSAYSHRVSEFADFTAHRFGAWSEDIDSEVNWLVEEGLVAYDRKEGIKLLGVRAAKTAVAKLGEEAELIREVLDVFKRLNDDELLVYVYTVYGGHEKSEKKELLNDKGLRLRTALKLYREGLVSLTLAARIAGMSTPEFAKVVRERLGGLVTGEKIVEA